MPLRPGPSSVSILVVSLVLVACAGGEARDDVGPSDGAADTTTDGAPSDDADDAHDVDDDTAPAADEPRHTPVEPDLSVALRLTDVATMDAPTAGAVGPDGVLHLAERAGTVHRLSADGLGDPVIDISAETTTDGERGLLGLAFASDGSELYLSSTDLDGDSVVSAVPVTDAGELVPGERRTLLRVPQPFSNHNGGNVAIGPDDLLYIGLGDGGGAGDPIGAGQDLGTPLGAMLRIDPSAGDPYGVPPDNPFVDVDGAEPEIWAYGLRNPWRFSFDRETGDLTIADVGQDAREEVNWVPAGEGAGANFGWNLREGTLEFAGDPPDDHVPPVHEYETRGPQGCAITGGYVYRGDAIPELTGAYLYSDVCDAALRAIVIRDGEVVDEAELDVGGEQVVSFAQDADGELYVLDFGGAVRRIDPA